MSYNYINHMKATGTEKDLRELIAYITQNRQFDKILASTKYDRIQKTQNPKTIKIKYSKKKEPYITYDYTGRGCIPYETHKKLAHKFPKLTLKIISAGEILGDSVEKTTYKNKKQQMHICRDFSKNAITIAAKLWWHPPYITKYIKKEKKTNKYYISQEYESQNIQEIDNYFQEHCTLEH